MQRGILLGLTVVFFACGCIDSKNPLSAPDSSKVDEGLVGTWRTMSGNNETFYHIGLAGPKYPKGMLRVVEVGRQDGVLQPPSEYLVFSSTIEGKTYLNVVIDQNQIKAFDKNGWKPDAVDGYFFVKYQLNGEKAMVWTVNSKFKEDPINARMVQGLAKEKGNARFTDTSENVAKLVAASGDALFNADQPGHMERVAQAKK